MPRVCVICSHPKRLRIDRMIVQGVAVAKIAQMFDVPYMSAYNHSRHHVSRQLLKATQMKQALDLEAVSHEFQSLYERAKDLFNRIEEEGPSHVSAALLRELRSTLETIAKWGISCETLSQQQAQAEAERGSASMRLAFDRLSSEELQMFKYLLAKMSGESPPELPGRSALRLPAPSTRQQAIVDITPEEKTAIQPNLVVSPPPLEEEELPAEEDPPKRVRTRPLPPQQPKKHQVWNARRNIAERLGINTKYERW